MSSGPLKLLAGAGATDDPVYVDDVFSTFLYEGASATNNIVNNIDVSGKGGLVWLKHRVLSGASATSNQHHQLYDTERGASYSLNSNRTNAQDNTGSVMTFNNNGFTLAGSNSVSNRSGNYYVSWTFRKQPGFFDIQTYTGSGENGQTINHDLDAVPGMVIIKQTTGGTTKWYVYHRSLASGKHLKLNTTDAESSDSNYEIGKTTCTSTQFSIDTGSEIDESGQTYIVYLFAHDDQRFGTDSDEAIIKCGTYTGNGSSSGVTVDLGFEPQWLFVKMSSHSGYYSPLVDSMRGFVVGGNDATVWPNVADAEYSGANYLDPTSTGFIATDTNNTNLSGKSYIYMAIARPHKPASEFSGTDLFHPKKFTTTGFTEYTGVGFPVDLALQRAPDSSDNWDVLDRLRGPSKYVRFNTDGAEATDTQYELGGFDLMDGVKMGTASNGQFNGYNPNLHYYFRRARGFFDIVAYTGNGSAGNTINHNLGVVPELMIVKNRDNDDVWVVYAGDNTDYLQLTSNSSTSDENGIWNDTSPTSSVFTVGNGHQTNANAENYIAFLFATTDGISKVGTYSGNSGSAINVDCGFSAGARFILIKRYTSSGDWYVWDTERGIVAGNDPYLFINGSAAGVTNTDYIDPLSSGFTVTSSAPNKLNNTGDTFLFLAIA